MGKGPFEDEDEEESETETETDDDEELGERRGRRIMIRVVSGKRSGGGGIEPETDGGGSLCCQADECSASLSLAKMYYRRHKVCERHAKAAVVLVAGIRQRFCQQCSRFHEISQFDDNKRSCRSRLAGHNERRRKAYPNLKQVEDGEEPSTMSEKRNPNCSGQLKNASKKHSEA